MVTAAQPSSDTQKDLLFDEKSTFDWFVQNEAKKISLDGIKEKFLILNEKRWGLLSPILSTSHPYSQNPSCAPAVCVGAAVSTVFFQKVYFAPPKI